MSFPVRAAVSKLALVDRPRVHFCSCARTYEVNADNQLGLAAAVPLDLGRVSGSTILLLKAKATAGGLRRGGLLRRRRARGIAGGRATINRRAAHGRRTCRRVAGYGSSRVDRGRASDHLGGRGAVLALLGEGTGATERGLTLEVGRVARGAVAGGRVVHGAVGCRGGGGRGRGRRSVPLGRVGYLRGRRGLTGRAARGEVLVRGLRLDALG